VNSYSRIRERLNFRSGLRDSVTDDETTRVCLSSVGRVSEGVAWIDAIVLAAIRLAALAAALFTRRVISADANRNKKTRRGYIPAGRCV
jgi:hypothetical protein